MGFCLLAWGFLVFKTSWAIFVGVSFVHDKMFISTFSLPHMPIAISSPSCDNHGCFQMSPVCAGGQYRPGRGSLLCIINVHPMAEWLYYLDWYRIKQQKTVAYKFRKVLRCYFRQYLHPVIYISVHFLTWSRAANLESGIYCLQENFASDVFV